MNREVATSIGRTGMHLRQALVPSATVASRLAASSPVREARTSAKTDNELAKATSKDYYFDSYSHFGIHEEMLKDQVRTCAYRDAILQNKHLFKGKIVLDVGCGTGILSMFAARAGARKVYGIECSGIANQAKEIIKVNGFSGVIEILHVKAEEATLPVDKVDIIISEWMGYFLFYESMLNSVLFARDKWLKPGGLLFPDKATLHISAIEDADYRAEKIDFWDAVYGFNMSCIKRMALLEPLIDTVYPESICSDVSKIFEIDINTVTVEDLSFRVPFCIRFLREDFCHALVVHFDITFPGDKRVSFSTGPQAHYTHWKQTVFYLLDTFPVCAGEELTGFIEQKPNKRNHRDLDIQLEYRFDGQHVQTKRQQSYRIR